MRDREKREKANVRDRREKREANMRETEKREKERVRGRKPTQEKANVRERESRERESQPARERDTERDTERDREPHLTDFSRYMAHVEKLIHEQIVTTPCRVLDINTSLVRGPVRVSHVMSVRPWSGDTVLLSFLDSSTGCGRRMPLLFLAMLRI